MPVPSYIMKYDEKRVKEISVTKLFGMFDYVIPLNLQERITIILGPNGTGKTILFKFLAQIFNPTLDFALFEKIPFDVFQITFEDGDIFRITKIASNSLELSLSNNGNVIHSSRYSKEKFAWFRQRISARSPFTPPTVNELVPPAVYTKYKLDLNRSEKRLITDYLKSRTAQSIDPRVLQFLRMSLAKIPKVPNRHPSLYFLGQSSRWIYSLRLAVPVRLIGADRAAVDVLSENTRAIALILRVLNTAASRNQLSPSQDAFHDFFQDRVNRIDLLEEVLNERFLYKQIRFSDQSGFTFNTDAGLEILPDDLSSGEKNLWRLFTELLFIDTPGTLVLLDEPELSLHLSWQINFLEGLKKILDQANIDVIIATHSPDIISDRWDLAVELEGPRNDQ